MRFEQLDYLMTVVRHGSLRRAAEEHHLSQPALSETLRNLERDLGVPLLERKRSGAILSEEGQQLLPYVMEVIEAVDRLSRAADQQHRSRHAVRVGTVNAATVPVLAPAIQAFRHRNPHAQVSVLPMQQSEIHRALLEGSIDLGLVNLLAGDEPAPDLESRLLLTGRVVACIRPDDPLADLDAVATADLAASPLIVMRAGYLMHRFVHRLFGGDFPSFAFTMDGAEMGKLMVAEGLGVTLLPDYSILGDPLERHGAVTTRPLAIDEHDARVMLYLQHRPAHTTPRSVRALSDAITERAGEFAQDIAAACRDTSHRLPPTRPRPRADGPPEDRSVTAP